MKLNKHKKTDQMQEKHLDFSLKENQFDIKNEKINQTLPAKLDDINNEHSEVSRSLKSKNPRRRNFNSKLSRNLIKSSRQLSYLVNNQNINVITNTSNSKTNRASKLNALNSIKLRRNQTIQHDDRENKPLQNLKKQEENFYENKSRLKLTLKEKSLNSIIINCLNETSNNSSGSISDCSTESRTSTDFPSLSGNSNSYCLNLPYFSTINKTSNSNLISDTVADLKHDKKSINKTSEVTELSSLKSENINVIVPSFRIKNFNARYKIEGTENLNDDTYTKRHQKLENEEIKIQKWDRMRQRHEYEKNKALMRENRHSSKQNSKANGVTSSVQVWPIRRATTDESTVDEKIIISENDLYIIEIMNDDIKKENQLDIKIQPESLPESKILNKKKSKKRVHKHKKRKNMYTRLSIQSLINSKKRKREISVSPSKSMLIRTRSAHLAEDNKPLTENFRDQSFKKRRNFN